MVSLGFKKSAKIHPFAFQETVPITFSAEGTLPAFFCDSEFKWCHFMLLCFISSLKGWNQLSSPVTIPSKKSSSSIRYPWRSLEVIVLHWLCGALSTSEAPEEQKFFYSPSFQSSPDLHGALIQVIHSKTPVVFDDIKKYKNIYNI